MRLKQQLIVYFSVDAACRDDRDAFNHLAQISCRYAVIATGSNDKQTLRSFKNPVLVFDAASMPLCLLLTNIRGLWSNSNLICNHNLK